MDHFQFLIFLKEKELLLFNKLSEKSKNNILNIIDEIKEKNKLLININYNIFQLDKQRNQILHTIGLHNINIALEQLNNQKSILITERDSINKVLEDL